MKCKSRRRGVVLAACIKHHSKSVYSKTSSFQKVSCDAAHFSAGLVLCSPSSSTAAKAEPSIAAADCLNLLLLIPSVPCYIENFHFKTMISFSKGLHHHHPTWFPPFHKKRPKEVCKVLPYFSDARMTRETCSVTPPSQPAHAALKER